MQTDPLYLFLQMMLSSHKESIYHECESYCEKIKKKIERDPNIFSHVMEDIKEADQAIGAKVQIDLDNIINSYSIYAAKWSELFGFDPKNANPNFELEIVKAMVYVIYIDKSEIDEEAFLSKTESHQSRIDFMKTQNLSCVDRHLLSLAEGYRVAEELEKVVKNKKNKEAKKNRIYYEYLIYTYVMEYNYFAVKLYPLAKVFLKDMLCIDIDKMIVDVLFRLSSNDNKPPQPPKPRVYVDSQTMYISEEEEKEFYEISKEKDLAYMEKESKKLFIWSSIFNEKSPNTATPFYIQDIKHLKKEYREDCKDKYNEAGWTLTDLIDQIARMGFIENSIEEKYSFAFQLTGVAVKPMHFSPIKWNGDSRALFAIIRHITEDNIEFNKWSRLDIFFDLTDDATIQFASQYSKRELAKIMDSKGNIHLERLAKYSSKR